MARKNGIISADSHVNPPATMYYERVPAKLKERAPRVESRGDHEVLVFEGREQRFGGLDSAAGTKFDKVKLQQQKAKSERAGGWDPHARIPDMDQDGVDAEVLFGSGAGGGVTIATNDREMKFGLMQAYNDWIKDFCAPYPDRLIGVAEIPHWDMDLAVAETKRARKGGLRGVLMPAVPAMADSPESDKPYTDPWYEPLWDTLEEQEMSLNFHLGPRPVTRGLESHLMIGISCNKSMMSEPMTSLIFSGVLMRHPKLKAVSVESGIGWMAFLLPWMDHVWERHRYHTGSTLEEPPSFYWHRQIFGTFIDDVVGVKNRDVIGVENIMWSSDYPHINSSWPNSQKYIDNHFQGVAEDEKRKMVSENVANLYKM